MKVLLVGSGVLPIPPPGWGAVERAIDGLARGLRAEGADVEVLNRAGHGRSRDEYTFALGLAGTVRRRGADVVHASTPVVANALRFHGVPYVFTSHSRHWSGTDGPGSRWGFWLERRACVGARAAVALTEEVAARMRSQGAVPRDGSLRVLPNGVDLDRFRAEEGARRGRALLGVGAIHPRKRWARAVEALAGLPGAQLTLVGPVQDAEYARRLTDRAPGRVTLAGEVSEAELAGHYARADVLVHPSGSEALSIAVLEAEASSLPVVGTSILRGALPLEGQELLLPEARPEGPEGGEFARVLAPLLADPQRRRALGEANRRHAEAHFAWPVIAREMLALYGEVIRAGAPPSGAPPPRTPSS